MTPQKDAPELVVVEVPKGCTYGMVCRMQISGQLEHAAREQHGTMAYHEQEKVMTKWQLELLAMARSARVVRLDDETVEGVVDAAIDAQRKHGLDMDKICRAAIRKLLGGGE